MRPVLYKNKGVGYFRGKKKKKKEKKKVISWQKKDTLAISLFSMNAAVWVQH